MSCPPAGSKSPLTRSVVAWSVVAWSVAPTGTVRSWTTGGCELLDPVGFTVTTSDAWLPSTSSTMTVICVGAPE